MAASSDLERNPWGVGGLGGDQTVVSGVVRLGSLDTVLSLAEVSIHTPSSMLHEGPIPRLDHPPLLTTSTHDERLSLTVLVSLR